MKIVNPVSDIDKALASVGIPITEGKGWAVVELTHEQLRQLTHSRRRETFVSFDAIVAMLGAHDLVRMGLGDQALHQAQEDHEAEELGLVTRRRRRQAKGKVAG